MKHTCLLLLAAVAVAPMAGAAPLTLDPAVIEEAKRAVFGGESVMTQDSAPAPAAAEQGDTALWQEAMDAVGTEMMPVLLLALLQRLNSHLPMQEHAARYAEALRLHVLAAAGNKAARMELAAALSVGVLTNGLRVPCDAALAEKMKH